MDLGAEKIKVVGDLRRLRVPRTAGRRRGRRSIWRWTASSPSGRRWRRNAEAEKRTRPFGSGAAFGRRNQAVDSRGGLRDQKPGAGGGCQRGADDECAGVHRVNGNL